MDINQAAGTERRLQLAVSARPAGRLSGTVRGVFGAVVLTAVLLAGGSAPAARASGLASHHDGKQKQQGDDPEVKIGRQNAAANDKDVKLVTDPAILERVNRIGQQIAAVANTVEVPAHYGTSTVKQFNYTFKVVDDKDVNAYSLPGGFIYVDKGLLDYVHSDDELAGVLAHECAHAAHHHMMKLMHEQSKIQNVLIPLLVVAAAASKGDGYTIGNAMMAGQLYLVAKLNTYGVEAEKDADATGLVYLTHTKYSPSGILTFMERLARDEQNSPKLELGIYRTHPPSPERAAALVKELGDLGVPVRRRDADPNMRAEVRSIRVNEVPLAEVRMYKVVIARFTESDGMTAMERGKKVADTINALCDDGLQMFEVHLTPDRSKLVAKLQTLIAFTQADADAQTSTIPQLTENAYTAMRTVLWKDQVDRPMGE